MTPYVLPTLPGYITNQVGTSINKVPNHRCLNQEVLVDEIISQKVSILWVRKFQILSVLSPKS